VHKVTGYPIGGVSPIGLSNKITILIDEDLMRLGRAWCAAGTPNTVIAVSPMLLARAIHARALKVD
jgi:prolyl-tRNA editing enzyme YbaK/EbsC (Cys-tRNA(Pro) deacylase)